MYIILTLHGTNSPSLPFIILILRILSSNEMENWSWMVSMNRFGRRWPWSRYYPSIYLEELMTVIRNISQDSWKSGLHLNWNLLATVSYYCCTSLLVKEYIPRISMLLNQWRILFVNCVKLFVCQDLSRRHTHWGQLLPW
jgi:hypothetical protein